LGGRGLTDTTRLHHKQVKLLQTYFFNKQVTSPLHAAVVKADERYTPLDLFRANDNELAADVEYNNKVKRQASQKALQGRHPYDLSQQYVDMEASNKWLTSADLFAETEGFLTAIQDQNVRTRNCEKYTLKQPNTDDVCRRCGKESETIQHITAACDQLATTEYVKRHDAVAKVIHQEPAEAAEMIEDKSPYHKYTPANVLENDNFKLCWNRSIITDKTTPFNRPDITFVNKRTKNTFLTDIAVPNTHNLAKTMTDKQTKKYQELAN
jgi:ribosomal protein L37E